MDDKLATKVVVKQTTLHGSNDTEVLQQVAVVYIEAAEYRVYGPPDARGGAPDWEAYFLVKQLADFNSEVEVAVSHGILAKRLVKDELERIKRDKSRVAGLNPDGRFYDAQICMTGHIKSYGGSDVAKWKYCDKCGAICLDECKECKTPIRGQIVHQMGLRYQRPEFCHGCGHPYPWMENRLKTAHELLTHDDKLSLDERNKLWDLLKYVMSDPKADLVPAKKKLIDISLEKATAATRDFVVDLLAKIVSESIKS